MDISTVKMMERPSSGIKCEKLHFKEGAVSHDGTGGIGQILLSEK